MCTTSDSTAEGIYTVVNHTLSQLLASSNSWQLCTAEGVDNTSVNIGIRNSMKIRVQKQNPSVYFHAI